MVVSGMRVSTCDIWKIGLVWFGRMSENASKQLSTRTVSWGALKKKKSESIKRLLSVKLLRADNTDRLLEREDVRLVKD